MIPIIGNTYPHREAIKALGGRWNAATKQWEVPEDKAEAAQKLVGPGSKPRKGYSPRTCKHCGCRINYGVFCGKCEFR